MKTHFPDGQIITFIGETNYSGQPQIRTTISTDAVTLSEILPVFEDFLRGMGFQIKGYLDIVDEEPQD